MGSCVLARQEGAKYSVIILEGNKINMLSYLKEDSELLVQEERERIVCLGSDASGLAYLVDKEHFYELKYL